MTQVENQVILFIQHLGRKAGLVIRTCIQEGDSVFIFSIGFQHEPLSEMTLKEQVFHAFWKVGLS